jgi:hypothetical protein
MAAFTTIAAGVGLAATAGSTGMSFMQASKQNKLKSQAESDAAKAMAEARKKLDVNFYDQLAIQKEPYELAREAALVQGAEALQAGVEGEQRGAGAVAGRIQMAQNEQQAGIRSAMGQELSNLEKLSAAEESRLRDMGVNLDLGEAQGAQLAARDAQQAATLATQQGMQGVTSMGQQVAAMAPLYSKDISGMKNAVGGMNFSTEDFTKFGNVAESGGLGAAGTGGTTNLDFDAIRQMNNSQFKQFTRSLTPQQSQMLFTNKQYTNALNPFNPF